MRRSPVRVAGILAALLFASAAVAAPAGAAKPEAKGTLHEPCTLITSKSIAKAFGAAASEPMPNLGYELCDFVVGDDPAVPLGAVRVVQLYPHFAQSTGGAKAAFQDQHAFDVVSEFELADVFGVGRGAYVNLTTGSVVVQATKKFMFSVEWKPTTPTTSLPKADQRRLKTLAKQIVKRAPQ